MKLSAQMLILCVSLFIVVFDNISFFQHVNEVYHLSWQNAGFFLSLGAILTALLVIVSSLFRSRLTLKPVLIGLLLLSAGTNYFMNTYNVILDETMIQNTFETNVNESLDLLTGKLVAYMVLLGVIPSFLVYRVRIHEEECKKAFFSALKSIVLALLIAVVMLFAFNRFYTSFFRENKSLRYYTNPTYCLYSAGQFIYHKFVSNDTSFKPLGEDATLKVHEKRRLSIIVVGEAARANRFSLNGYERKTNPLLEKENVINLFNVSSCGTSTAISVPCMFSYLDREHYSDQAAKSMENVLDILKRAGVSVLWRDNNSDSKGVALRVNYEDYKVSSNNRVCDEECRDEGMLIGLQEFVNAQKGDIVIVLHQMGNHGPAYYKRYPKAFESFKPVCLTNQVEKCSPEEIGNAYDNAILYTDYFLSKTIAFLKQNDAQFETAMIYMADHGESLGEKGLYLHGIPYMLAPEEQTHVGAMLWFGQQSEQRINTQGLRENAQKAYSHDNLFHTILGLTGVQTAVYNPSLDMLLYKQ